MTEYAMPPIMLTSNTNQHSVRRRSSIRRGTIASICKDVRVNDVVEIIKKQKALQQQERTVVEDKLLKRRHSMMNLQPNKSVIAKVSDNKQMAKSRLVAEEETGVINHLRKCIACHQQEVEDCCSSNNSSSSEDNCLSPSTSSSSSSNLMRPKDVEQRGQLIENLNASMVGYSTHIQEFIHNSAYYNEHEYKTKVDTCKALVAQQQSLLNKLESLPESLPYTPALSLLEEPTPIQKNISPIKSLYTEIYKGLKSSTTGFTIKQKKDKSDADTIIAVQGVCTTIESSLIPDRVRPPCLLLLLLFIIILLTYINIVISDNGNR